MTGSIADEVKEPRGSIRQGSYAIDLAGAFRWCDDQAEGGFAIV